MASRDVFPVTIANGASLSGAVYVGARRIVGLMMPAAWTAASITFAASTEISATSQTYGKVQNEAGTEKTLTTPGADTYIHFDTPIVAPGSIKVRSGVAATPVNQGGDRVIKLVTLEP